MKSWNNNSEASAMTAQEAFSRLSALCAKGEHCRQEMVEKMGRWGLGDDEQAEVLQRLADGRYVDDARYARAFVNDKVRYSKWGRRKIEQALWMKHIDEATVQEALDDISDEEYVEVLRPLVEQKKRTTRAANDYELRMKVVRFALGRGFTMEVIDKCLDEE